MNSRQIIIDLIDKQIINGEQAFTLINDIIQSELLESWKALNNKENKDLLKVNNSNPWITTNPSWVFAGDSATSTLSQYSTSSAVSSK